jgi:hypothetical protein
MLGPVSASGTPCYHSFDICASNKLSFVTQKSKNKNKVRTVIILLALHLPKTSATTGKIDRPKHLKLKSGIHKKAILFYFQVYITLNNPNK